MHMFSKGKLVYRESGGAMPVEVHENEDYRWLRFGDQAVQSAMSLARPRQPVLAHIQAMLSGMVLLPAPERALMLGLGGGDLARALPALFPRIELLCVEHDRRVLEVAKTWFALPESLARDTVLEDACEYLSGAALAGASYDLLFVDIVQGLSVPACVRRLVFFDDCREVLSPGGMAVFNFVFENQNAFRELLAMVRTAFGQAVLCLPVSEHRNVIVFALRAARLDYRREFLYRRIGELNNALACDLTPYLDTLLEINLAADSPP